jgi:hypothetical protein
MHHEHIVDFGLKFLWWVLTTELLNLTSYLFKNVIDLKPSAFINQPSYFVVNVGILGPIVLIGSGPKLAANQISQTGWRETELIGKVNENSPELIRCVVANSDRSFVYFVEAIPL